MTSRLSFILKFMCLIVLLGIWSFQTGEKVKRIILKNNSHPIIFSVFVCFYVLFLQFNKVIEKNHQILV